MEKPEEAIVIYNQIWKNCIKPVLEALKEEPKRIMDGKWIRETYMIQYDAMNGNEFGQSMVVGFFDYLAREDIKYEARKKEESLSRK